MGSSSTIVTLNLIEKLKLSYDTSNKTLLYGYGNGHVATLGTACLTIEVDEVKETITVHVVPNSVQEVPVLLGGNFAELPNMLIIKDDVTLKFYNQTNTTDLNKIEPDINESKIVLRLAENSTVFPNHWGHVTTYNNEYDGDVCLEASLRSLEGNEYCIPHTAISLKKGECSLVPCINLTNKDINFKKDKVYAREMPCIEEEEFSIAITL